MKKILIFGLVLLSLTTQAQLDGTYPFFAADRGSVWKKVSGAPAYMIDGFRGTVLSNGDTVLKVRADGNWKANDLAIYADGTDQTTKINTAYDLSFVKSILFTSDSARTFSVTGAVYANNKIIKFENGCVLDGDGTGSIDSIVIDAPDKSQLWDADFIVGNVTQSSSGHYSVMWWGADNTNTNDATAALNKAMSLGINNALIYFPSGEGYKTSDSVVLNPLLNLKMDAPIVSTDTTKPALIIGPVGPNANVLASHKNKEYKIWALSSTLSTWTDTNHVGVILRNLSFCNIYPVKIRNYTWGLKYYGNSAGVAYNNTFGGSIENNAIGVMLAVGGSGWVNQNNWFGTNFLCNSSTNVSKVRYGVQIGNTDYVNNNNNFYGNSFELQSSTLGIPVYIYSGSFNSFNEIRDEQNSSTTFVIRKGSANADNRENRMTTGYGGGNIVDSSRNGLNSIEPVTQRNIMPANYTTVTGMDNITEKINYYGSDSTLYIAPPAYFASSSSTAGIGGIPSSTRVTGLLVRGDYLQIGTGSALVTEDVDVSRVKKFVLFRDVMEGAPGRIRVQYFDSSYRNISDTRSIQGYSPYTYATSFGGSWGLTVDSDHWQSITVPDEAKIMRIMFTSGTNVLRIKSYKLISLIEGSVTTSSYLKNKNSSYGVSNQMPSIGSYVQGKVILNDMTTDSTTYGWVCYQAGTFGTLTGVTGSISNNSNRLILNSGSGALVEKGYILQIGSLRLRIIGTSGDTCWLDRNASGTLTGAAIDFAVPKLKAISADGSGGGTGDVTYSEMVAAIDSALAAQPDVFGYNVGGYDTIAGMRGDSTIFKSFRWTNSLTSTKVGDSIIYVDVNEANLTGIPQSSVTSLTSDLAAKQATLVSGTNIKTIDGQSIVGSGDLDVTVAKNSTRDSIVITVGGNRYAVKDSIGAGGGSSYWTQSGSNIYYNTGNVYIGKTSGSKKLDVLGDAAVEGKLTLTNPSATINTEVSLFGTNSLSRLMFRPGTTDKAQGFYISPNGTGNASGYNTLFYMFANDFEASGNYLSVMQFQMGAGLAGINMRNQLTGTLEPFNIYMNDTKALTVNTDRTVKFHNVGSGTGGTDSVLVKSGGVVKAISPTYYATSSGGGSGTVNTGTANRLTYYSSSGTTVDDLAAITASRALVSDANGLPVAATTTTTELNYLSGVTSAVQTQITAKMTNPMTTAGDIIYGGSSGTPTRLAKGTSGYVLTQGATNPSWAAPAVVREDVEYVNNADYTFVDGVSSAVLSTASADKEFDLPAASSYTGRVITVRNASNYLITFNYAVTYNSTTGDANLRAGRWVTMQSDGSVWVVIAQGGDAPTSGNYTPTMDTTSLTGTVGRSIKPARWWRIGNQVHVEGQIRFTVIVVGSKSFTLTLPVPATLVDEADLTGGVWSIGGTTYALGQVNGSDSGTVAEFILNCAATENYIFNYSYSYTIYE